MSRGESYGGKQELFRIRNVERIIQGVAIVDSTRTIYMPVGDTFASAPYHKAVISDSSGNAICTTFTNSLYVHAVQTWVTGSVVGNTWTSGQYTRAVQTFVTGSLAGLSYTTALWSKTTITNITGSYIMPTGDDPNRPIYVAEVETVPTDGAKNNPSVAYTWTAGEVTQEVRTIGGTPYTRTIVWSGGEIQSKSAWS